MEGTKIPNFLIGKNYVYVSQFKNLSGESNLSQIFTRNVRNSFLKDGRLKPADKNKANVSLQAKIIEYKLIPVGFSKDDQVKRYRVFVKIEYELSDLTNGDRLQFKKIETEIEFEISSKVDESDKNRNDAVEKGAENFSLELLDTIFETF
ncbi:MAG: LPS assembly lipoprotein LptE [Nitrospinota bacterium]|nr:LPS assembly lipoprotein LptE [Nitrospinota bacterium]